MDGMGVYRPTFHLQHLSENRGNFVKKFTAFFLIFFFVILVAEQKAFGDESTDEAYGYLLDLSLEELVNVSLTSSGLFVMDWDKSPGIYYVADKEKLDTYGIRSIGEYLDRMIPGVSTATHGNQGTTIGVRGILTDTNSKTLLLRDNLNLNNRTITGIGGSKLSSPLLGDIDRVEVALGPSALRHGSGAINGSINIISSTGESKEGVRSNLAYGSGNSKMAEGSFGSVLSDKVNVFFYGGYSKSDGVKPYYTLPANEWAGLGGVTGTPSPTFLDNAKVGTTDDDYKFSFRGQVGKERDFFHLDFKAMLARTTNVDPALGYYLSPLASWPEEVRLAAESRNGRYSPFYVEYDQDILISPEVVLNLNKTNEIKIIPFYLDQKGGNEFSDDLLNWVDKLNIALAPKNDCAALGCSEDYQNYGYETQKGLTLIHNYKGFPDQNIAWGGEVKKDEFEYFKWDWTTASLFGEDQIVYGDFSFLIGIRYDTTFFGGEMPTIPPYTDGPYQAPEDVDSFTKRLAATYSFYSNQALKLSYQEGFRFADKWPQHWAKHQALVNGNSSSDLEPETSKNYELGYSAVGLLGKRLRFSASLFHNTYKDTQGWIAEQYNFGNSPVEITAYGGEANMEYKPTRQSDIGLSYSFSKPDDSYETSIKVANTDDTWTRYPVHMIKFHLGYTFLDDKLFVGGTGILESARYDKQLTDPRVENLFNEWDFRMDMVIAYSINKNTKLSFSAKELITDNYNQSTAYFQGTRPLDSPRAADPQYFLQLSFAY
jgi:outer membrane receptor protein involved in Fe transport